MKISAALAMAVAGVLAFGVASAQASPKKRFDERTQSCRVLTFYNSGWVSEGSKIFKASCQSCHSQGNDKGAPFLYTETKSMKGWNRVFTERYPKCATTGAWAQLTDDDLEKLNDYLYHNAANTYDANTAADCG
ncbi:MAG: cytochrome c [Desulfobulbaceae bacterium]|nr:cytochrome c [Desulfobulbaceae bacterium]